MIDYTQRYRLDEKTAFVFGGAGLIGRDVSIALASAGAKTIILDLDSSKGVSLLNQITDAGFIAYFRNFDCSDLENLEISFSALVEEFGTPAVFINASYPRTRDWGKNSFQDISLDSFRKNVDIHLNSYVWLAKIAAESMKAIGKGGSIIQLGSIYGILGQDLTVYDGTDMHENMTYAAIKGGITNTTRQMASYYGQFNIRVNTLVPGGLSGHVAGQNNAQHTLFVEKYTNKTPLKRLGLPDEIATSALFLASDAASYVTGTMLIVDGGWSTV